MTDQEKCPFGCGEESDSTCPDVLWLCGSSRNMEITIQSDDCRTRRESQLHDSQKTLKALIDRIKAVAEAGLLTVKLAQVLGVCRLCGGKALETAELAAMTISDCQRCDPFILNYGREFAHRSCLDKKQKRPTVEQAVEAARWLRDRLLGACGYRPGAIQIAEERWPFLKKVKYEV